MKVNNFPEKSLKNRRFFQFIDNKSPTFSSPDALPGVCSTDAEKSAKYRIFPIFRRKIGDFLPIFFPSDFFHGYFYPFPSKTDFLLKNRPKKAIFCSLYSANAAGWTPSNRICIIP